MENVKNSAEKPGKSKSGRRDMWINASFTIETALLIPIVIGLLLLFCQTALFFHDRNVLVFLDQQATTCGRNLRMAGEEDVAGKTGRYAAELSENAAVFGSDASLSVSGGQRQLRSEAAVSFSDWFPGWQSYSGRSADNDAKVQDSEWIEHPCTLIRGYRLLKEGIEMEWGS